jgi:hypothetical protein
MIRLVCQKGVISSMPFHSALPPTREETTMGKDSLMIRQFMVGISAFKYCDHRLINSSEERDGFHN